MIVTELPLPFQWYPHRLRQERFRENCIGLLPWELFVTQESMLPFQFQIPKGAGDPPTIEEWNLYNACEDNEIPGVGILEEGGDPILEEEGDEVYSESDPDTPLISLASLDIDLIEIIDNGNFYNIIFKGQTLSAPLPCGLYEASIKFSDGSVWWSEVFRVIGRVNGKYPYLLLKWKHTCDLGGIIYSTGYENKLFLDSFLAHTEPDLLEEVEKDGAGTEVVKFSKFTFKYRFSEIVPDYIKEALVAMTLHRIKTVTDRSGLISFQVSRARVNSSVEGGGCFSFVDILLEQDQVLIATSCC
jgi:hypothetical protein